ncbi:MAG TPA: hypothetical protein VGE12_14575 [Noviherbaspirillum sp.]
MRIPIVIVCLATVLLGGCAQTTSIRPAPWANTVEIPFIVSQF